MPKSESDIFRLDDEYETGAAVEKIERRKPYEAYIEADLGLRNHWFAAFFGPELEEGGVRGEMICGERIVFKRVDGTVYAMADRCPHRGAAFTSRPECFSKDTLTCWLHGFTFDVRDGSLVQILTEPESPLIGKLKHQTYPVQELNSVVFVFIGDADPAPPIERDIQPKFFTKNLVIQPMARNKHLGNWRLAAENGYDAAHLYAHRHAGMFEQVDVPVPLSTFSSTKDQVTIVDSDDGPWGIVKFDDVNVWQAEIDGKPVTAANVKPGEEHENWDIEVGLFMPCGLEVDYFPMPGVMQFEWYTPVDEDHHMYLIACGAACEDETAAESFRERCRTELGPMVWKKDTGQGGRVGDGPDWGFNNFDAWGREHMHHVYQYEDYWHRERLFKPDYIVVQWRMLVSKRMRGQQQRGDWARTTTGWSPDGRNYDPALGPEDF